MAGQHGIGGAGEKEVIRLVRCPNCGKRLKQQPPGYPLYDVHCTACSFRAQVKTNQRKPKNVNFGAGWTILKSALKTGAFIPPLIVNSKGGERSPTKREIRFYPFIPRDNIKKRGAAKGSYPMFNYIGLLDLPYMTWKAGRWSANCGSERPTSQRGGSKTSAPRKQRADGRLSCLDAAAKVLVAAGQPMSCPALIQAMKIKGYWVSKAGKTPTGTLNAALMREIKTKVSNSRFRKTDRGLFAAAAH